MTPDTLGISAHFTALRHRNINLLTPTKQFFSRHKHIANPLQFMGFRRAPILKYAEQLIKSSLIYFIDLLLK